MHIPDGFLDPSTCAATYIATLPFWILAFRRAKNVLSDKQVPLLATLTAMFFAAQMMNYPIVGGTTAHLLGGPIVAITLGPYAGVISMTLILLIQALMFGDGGITTFGANVLNMGVVGVFVPYVIFLLVKRVAGGRAGLLAGSFLGAFFGDLLAAVSAGFELGLSTLYFPYSLSIAVTAMAAHHSIIGVVEGIATVAILSALMKARHDLLQLPKVEPVWFRGLSR
ncbi:MAG: energy-coupling factor ABC transporter permease [Candidatus Bathyarchaeia archaeon]